MQSRRSARCGLGEQTGRAGTHESDGGGYDVQLARSGADPHLRG